MAEVIAIGISLAALIISLRREWLDRPVLHVAAAPDVELGASDGGIMFTVENRGRQPVTIGELGTEFHVDGVMVAGHEVPHGRITARPRSSRLRIEAGGHHQERVSVHEHLIWHVDVPMRPFVQHGGRRTYGATVAPYRELLIAGWKPDERPPRELLKPCDPPLRTSAIEPRWKLWKPRRLRRAETGWTGSPPPWTIYEILRGSPEAQERLGEWQ